MVSEADHATSGPPNTDTEEEADPDKEPRRRSARTAAKVYVPRLQWVLIRGSPRATFRHV